jgi:hypothetical protein
MNEGDEKIKTYKVGQIARALAVFRIDDVYVYNDPKLDESKFIIEILEYLNTPQYLRKTLFPLKGELKYAGVLPPLQIPSHRAKHLKIGEVREGVVRKVTDGKAWVDIGADALALMNSKSEMGARLAVRVCSKKPLVVEETKPLDYWGYEVKEASLEELLSDDRAVIASRKCKTPEYRSISAKIRNGILVIFGNPEEGVHRIAQRLRVKIEAECWNMVPAQGTETVRLEEAIFASLAVINFIKQE